MSDVQSDMTFHHMGVAVPELAGAIAEYREIFGYSLASGPFNDPIQKVSVCFLARGGEPQIELVAPFGEASPIKRLLSSGGGAYHFCYEVPDIEKAIADVRARKCLVISGPVRAVAFGNRRIAWFYTPARQLVELLEASGSRE